jgi:hypothetical protein
MLQHFNVDNEVIVLVLKRFYDGANLAIVLYGFVNVLNGKGGDVYSVGCYATPT